MPSNSGIMLEDMMRLKVCVLYFSICCATGSRWVSTSKAALEVAPNASRIALAPRACMLRRVSSVFTVYGVPLLLEFDQTEHVYLICGTTTPF